MRLHCRLRTTVTGRAPPQKPHKLQALTGRLNQTEPWVDNSRHLARLTVVSEAWLEALTREVDAVRVAETQTNVAAKTTLAVAATPPAEAELRAVTTPQKGYARITTIMANQHGTA